MLNKEDAMNRARCYTKPGNWSWEREIRESNQQVAIIAEALLTVQTETAKECAGLAEGDYWGKADGKIRAHFGLEAPDVK